MIAREIIAVPQYVVDVERGLTSSPKTLPTKLFYDARGSELFEAITELPEYYPTRTELEILQEHSAEIAISAGTGLAIVELGAGTAAKTCTLLKAVAARQMRVDYVPVDISRVAVREARDRVRAEVPQSFVRPMVVDFSEGFDFLRSIPGRRLVLYLGSSIGNFDPPAAVEMLESVCNELASGDALLLGTDLVKSPEILVPAYDDAQGVTAEFNKNILSRLNRELGANFDLDSFRHIACWNGLASRMEMHLESIQAQTVDLKMIQLPMKFRAGERIHTENSYKYTIPMVSEMLSASGFSLEKTWFDQKQWFALHLARV
jgi:dimethylhistidine N-methyltransferase